MLFCNLLLFAQSNSCPAKTKVGRDRGRKYLESGALVVLLHRNIPTFCLCYLWLQEELPLVTSPSRTNTRLASKKQSRKGKNCIRSVFVTCSTDVPFSRYFRPRLGEATRSCNKIKERTTWYLCSSFRLLTWFASPFVLFNPSAFNHS